MKRDARIGLAVVLVLGLMVTLLVARAIHNRSQQMEAELSAPHAAEQTQADYHMTGLSEFEAGAPPDGSDPRMAAVEAFRNDHPTPPFDPPPAGARNPAGASSNALAEVVDLPDEGYPAPAPARPATASAATRNTATLPPIEYTAANSQPSTAHHPAASPLPAFEPEPAPAPERLYTVEAGDNPWKISAKVFGDGKYAQKIIDANPGLDPARLKIGQELKLPNLPAAQAAATQATSAPGTVPAAPRTYVVQAGDTLGGIAHQHLGSSGPKSIKRLLDANPGLDPRRMQIGMSLKIPAQP
ncbi:MAG: LysM peptidoglycan-binding domain-containing protein [Planctomycetota bacterium]|nr:LysM peptidoglycan-binding domain-containing protein [Planctomycetota bacterium]